MLRTLCLFGCFSAAVLAYSAVPPAGIAIEIPVVCQSFITPRDVEQIRAILLKRRDIRQPLFGITCGGGCAITQSGPRRDNAICNFVTLAHRHGKWHIIKIEEGPITIVTRCSPEGPNQTMKLTATCVRFGHAVVEATFLSPQIGLCPSGRSLSCSR